MTAGNLKEMVVSKSMSGLLSTHIIWFTTILLDVLSCEGKK